MSFNTEKEKAIVRALIQRSKEGKTITYKELSQLDGVNTHWRGFGKPLEVIGKTCKKKEVNMPLLPSLVVRVDTHLPGEGFYLAFAKDKNLVDKQTKKVFVKKNQKRVFNYKEWDEALKRYLDYLANNEEGKK